MVDPFDSSTVSLTLAWIIGVLMFAWIASIAVNAVADFFAEREAHSSRWLPWFGVYFLLCFVVISPMRYMILQFLLIDSYSVQSFNAVANSLIAGIYVVSVSGVLFAASVALPSMLLFTVLKNERTASLIAGTVLAPFMFAVGYALFFLLLPYAAWTIHWLPARDVIRSANGPATVFYKLAVESDIPRIGPKLVIQEGETANERLRSHVRTTYVSRFKNTKLHFADSLRYVRHAHDVLNKQEGVFVTIPPSDVEAIMAAERAALREATQVDTDLLNEYLVDLGTMYRDKFIPGLEAAIQGWESPDILADLRGQVLLNQWGDWYNERLDAIWDAL
jgi:hypothetical protein